MLVESMDPVGLKLSCCSRRSSTACISLLALGTGSLRSDGEANVLAVSD
jgi:hypothetical protein